MGAGERVRESESEGEENRGRESERKAKCRRRWYHVCLGISTAGVDRPCASMAIKMLIGRVAPREARQLAHNEIRKIIQSTLPKKSKSELQNGLCHYKSGAILQTSRAQVQACARVESPP